MRVALVHEWLEAMAGSEKVLIELAAAYPQADLFTLVCDRARLPPALAGRTIATSFIDRLPRLLRRHFRLQVPLMPLAIEQLDLSAFEVVVSSSHAVAKGVLTRSDQLHVSYVHTPMRYAWDLYQPYLDDFGARAAPRGWLTRLVLHYLRLWDVACANRVDAFVANSAYVARRIAKTYRRAATVIHPPVAVERFDPGRRREDFHLCVGRLVPYKRLDVIIDCFNRNGLPLVVIGQGSEQDRLAAAARPNVRLLGWQDDAVVRDHLETCRAFVTAADEDFGITTVEAQAAGAPVIALRRGGAMETVREGRSGVFFDEPTPQALQAALAVFAERRAGFDASAISAAVARFGAARFRAEFTAFVERCWDGFTPTATAACAGDCAADSLVAAGRAARGRLGGG